jgi:hypothetical protein
LNGPTRAEYLVQPSEGHYNSFDLESPKETNLDSNKRSIDTKLNEGTPNNLFEECNSATPKENN